MVTISKRSAIQPGLKITPEILQFILDQHSKTIGLRSISKLIEAKFGVTISKDAIGKALRRHGPKTSADIQAALSKNLPSDLEVLETRLEKCVGIVVKFEKRVQESPEDVRGYALALEQYRKLIELKLRYSGNDAPLRPKEQARHSGPLIEIVYNTTPTPPIEGDVGAV